MTMPTSLAGIVAALLMAQPTPDGAPSSSAVRAKYLIVTADDFVVDIYHNGRAVPDAKRTLLREVFGATVERIDIEVKTGDWLVFNVVNNRLRWGGASYFGVAGCFARDEFGFVSRPGGGDWFACDTPKDVDWFIAEKNYFAHHLARPIGAPWDQGDSLMKEYAGSRWDGAPVWGTSRNTWIKVIVD